MSLKRCSSILLVAVGMLITQTTEVWAHSGSANLATIDSCTADMLSVSAPLVIPGDPGRALGSVSWNLLFRNVSSVRCSVSGWPETTVQDSYGRLVPTHIEQVAFTNLAVVVRRRVDLQPGATAVVTASSPTSAPGCTTDWSLSVRIATQQRPVVVTDGPSTNPFRPCVGGTLNLSPFYSYSDLRRQIAALSAHTTPTYPLANTRAARICAPAPLDLRPSSAAHFGNSTALTFSVLTTAASPCVLRGAWPSLRLRMVDGSVLMAKAGTTRGAVAASTHVVRTFGSSPAASVGALATMHDAVGVTLLMRAAPTQKCPLLRYVILYPGGAAGAAGRAVAVGGSIRVCAAEVLPFTGSDAIQLKNLAHEALHADSSATGQAAPSATAANASGFYYGTDSAAPLACGSGPYYEPNLTCSNGHQGYYGFYSGEVGSWLNWKGCSTNTLPYSSFNANAADSNEVNYGYGNGAAPYWYTAGPGRDPNWNGTTSEASAWGALQAQAAWNAKNSKSATFLSAKMVLDAETDNNSSGNDRNGWNTVWNGPCGGTVRATSISAALDIATYNGFQNWIYNNTYFGKAVYAAGGSCSGCWAGIFGSYGVGANVATWTFVGESQTKVYWPNGYCNAYDCASWFGGAPSNCHSLWQFAGGNGKSNGYGDFDNNPLWAGNYYC